jgi:transcriptional regulator with XRE-family HTH domain
LLKLTQAELGEKSRVAKKTVADFELETRVPYNRTLEAIRMTLEELGVTFLDANGGGPGVRLREP